MAPLRIFFSSPGDVGEERLLAQRVVDRLRVEFASHGVVEPIFWEHEPLRATASFQDQIPRPSDADIVVFILWSRLGTRLPAHIRKPDGTPYSSGTEFEFEDAAESCRRRGVPDLIVYRKAAEPFAPLDRTVIDRLAQKEALDAFIEKWFRGADGSFTAAFHAFETAGQFENLLDTHLRKLIHERLPQHAGHQVEPPVWIRGSPFCGLEAFTFDRSPVFFGRTQAVSDVLNALRKQAIEGRPFVLIMGMSGVGKSSLARAGVLPGLTRPGVIEGIGLWRWAAMRPSDGANLFETLAAALVAEHALPELIGDGTTVSDLARLLRESPNAVPALVRARLHQAAEDARRLERLDAAPSARLVLLVDQLEELFTQPRHTSAERSQWMAAVSSLAHSGLVWVLATMRSDFYPSCAELPDLVALKEGAGQYDLRPPNAHEVSQMIRYPARLAGVTFEENAETGERLDDILRDAAVKDSQALPLLEFTLDELYRRHDSGKLTLSAYRALGGVEGALGKRAEEEFARLTPDVQSALPALVGALVTVGLGDTSPVTRRRTPIAAVTPTASARALVDALVNARLLIADRADDGTAVVQFAHDSLLRYWPRVRDWIQDSLDTLKLRSRVRTAAALWSASGESQAYLLPDDSTLAVAARYLESNRADLDEHEAPFIESSIKAAGRRRRRTLLNRAAATAAVLALAAAGTWYWDAYHRVHVNYYATFVYQWLKPIGVQSLAAREIAGRPVSVRFTRTHGRRGQVDRIEHVDRDGNCTAPGVLVTAETFLGIDSTKLEDIFNQEDADEEPCRLEYSWKADGSVDLIQGFSPQNRHLYTLQFVSPSMAYFTDEHGLAKARFTTGAAYINFALHEDGPEAGFVQSVRYLDAAGKPQADAQGSYGVTLVLDPNGLPARCTMLGEHGLPAALPTGVSSLGIALTPGFLVKAVEIFDLAGSLAELKGIGARLAMEYDDRNNIRRAVAVDRSGKPYLTGWGFSALSMTYDGQNRLTETRIFGEGGAPGAPDGTFIRRMSYDSEGRLTEMSTLGSDERLTNGADGYAVARFVHDDLAHRSEELYFGADRNPIVPPSLGYHRGVTSHDEAGRPVETRFFGADGRPVVAQAGCAVFKTSYDGEGRDLRYACFGPDGKPMLVAGKGWAATEFVYHDGAETEARLFDADGKSVRLDAARTEEQFFVVTEIEPGSEAHRVGLKPGDLLRSYNQHEITTSDALLRDISAPGTTGRELRVERDGKAITFDVKPGRLGFRFVQGSADQLKEWGARPQAGPPRAVP